MTGFALLVVRIGRTVNIKPLVSCEESEHEPFVQGSASRLK
jgi:hypothetical protein